MAREFKKVTFSGKEAVVALCGFSKDLLGKVLEPEAADSVEFGSERPIQASLALRGGGRMTFTESQLVQALIWWCVKERVPMKRSADKSVTVEDGEVSLEIRMMEPGSFEIS